MGPMGAAIFTEGSVYSIGMQKEISQQGTPDTCHNHIYLYIPLICIWYVYMVYDIYGRGMVVGISKPYI